MGRKKRGSVLERPGGKKGDGKPGPKTLCTPAMVRLLAKGIQAGASLEAACGAAGIDAKSLRDWRENAEKGIEPYASILPPLKKAMACAVGQAETRVFAGKMGWQASARWLESMKPAVWRRTEAHAIQGGDKPIKVDMDMGQELLRKMLAFAVKPGVPGVGGKE